MKQLFVLSLLLGIINAQPLTLGAVNRVTVIEKELQDKQKINTEDSPLDRLNPNEQGYKSKPTFKEKIALLLVKNTAKNTAKKSYNSTLKYKNGNGFATAGFGLGFLGVLIFLFFGGYGLLVAPLFSVLAIIFSSIALKRIKYSRGKPGRRTLAILGLIFGILSTLTSIVLWGIVLLFTRL